MNQNKRDACEKPASAYVHVPFCHGICAYCAFYRQVSQDRSAWLQQICQQIRETDIGHLDTLYFGGGTPSILTEAEFDELRRLFPKDVPEFTLECNPEDVTPQKAAFWRSRGVNRVSMGVQTFDDRRLKAIGRRHTGEQALGAVKTLQEAGITNLSIDLIFVLPGQTQQDEQQD